MARARTAEAAPFSASVRFLVVAGKDRFLQDEYLQSLRSMLAAIHGADGVDTVRFDGAQGARIVADVLDECRSFGLMNPYKIVLVDNADALLKGDDDDDGSAPAARTPGTTGKRAAGATVRRASASPRDMLEHYAAAPSDSATLVLRAPVWRGGKLEKAVESLGERGVVLKCEPPSEEGAVVWAIKRCERRHECTIEQAAAESLIDAVGADLGRVDSELAKLAVAAGGRGEPITSALVSEMTGITREDELWGIQERLLRGHAGDALAHLRQLVDVSRVDAVPLTWAYVDLARKVHAASRGTAQGVNASQIRSSLRAWGPALDAIMARAQRVHPAVASGLFKRAIETDAAGKSGVGEPMRNLEMLTVTLTTAWSAGSVATSTASRK